jgi:hypothetical protein
MAGNALQMNETETSVVTPVDVAVLRALVIYNL